MDLRTQTLQLLQKAGAVEEKVIGHKSVYRFPSGKRWNFAGIIDLKMFLRRNGMESVLEKKKPAESDPGSSPARKEKKRAGAKKSNPHLAFLELAVPPAPRTPTFSDKLIDAVGAANTSRGAELRNRYVPRFHPESEEESRQAREYLAEQDRIHREEEERNRAAIREAEAEYERTLEHQPYKSGYRKPTVRAEVMPVIKMNPEELLMADRILKYQGQSAYNEFVRETLAAKRNPQQQQKGEQQMRTNMTNIGQVNAARAIEAQITNAKEQLRQLKATLEIKKQAVATDEQKIKDIETSLTTLESPAVKEAMVLMHATTLANPETKIKQRQTQSQNGASNRGKHASAARQLQVEKDMEILCGEDNTPISLRALIETGHYSDTTEGALYQTMRKMSDRGDIEKVDENGAVRWAKVRVSRATAERASA